MIIILKSPTIIQFSISIFSLFINLNIAQEQLQKKADRGISICYKLVIPVVDFYQKNQRSFCAFLQGIYSDKTNDFRNLAKVVISHHKRPILFRYETKSAKM
ncbi:MAG: hypothetical protein DRH21_05665 [Deltaproteobacteria bacterium]|nr:MAG: hypothetical protein DRH21_05665 [Deltaproteobacteria bacterium]